MKVNSEAAMLALGEQLAKLITPPTVIELVGDVGAGKTTLTRGIAQGLGVQDAVTSPSFLVSKRYEFPRDNSTLGTLIHYDFYNLPESAIMRSELAEALARDDAIIIVEWGTSINDLLPPDRHTLTLTLCADGSREITSTSDLWKTCAKHVENHPTNVQNPTGNVQNLVPNVENPSKTVENSPSCGKPVDKNIKNVQKSLDIRGKNMHKTPIFPSKNVQNPQNLPAAPQNPSKSSKNPQAVAMYLDTSDRTCHLRLNQHKYTWEAGHDMARGLFAFIRDKLALEGADWSNLASITYFSGPGSFTGLRIGASIVNTLADQLQIPLYDHHGVQHQIILPDYGRPANISAPRK